MKKNILILLALAILSCQKDKNDKEKLNKKMLLKISRK